MTWFLIYLFVLLPFFLSFFTRFYGSKNVRFVKKLKQMTYLCFAIVALVFILRIFNVRLNGTYSDLSIYIAFEIVVLVYFLKVPTDWLKIALDFVLIPTYILVLFGITTYTLPFQTSIDNTFSVTARTAGFLACGETISITKNQLWVFQQEIYGDRPCLRGVHEIDILEFTDDSLIIDIHHDGTMDSENPYRFEVENKGYW